MGKSKDNRKNNLKRKSVTEKGSSPSGSIDTSELRRSTRGTPSKKEIMPRRKSTRLEKQAPVTSPIKSKLVVVATTSTPLRRSDRGKKQENSSSSSGLKKLENKSNSPNNTKTKGRTRRSVRRLMVESAKVSRSNKSDSKLVGSKRKRISISVDDGVEEPDKSGHYESSGNETSEQNEEGSSSKKSESTSKDSVGKQSLDNSKEIVRYYSEEHSSESSENHSKPNVSSDPDNCKSSENEDKLVDSTCVETSTGCNISVQISHKQYARKRCKIACEKTQEDAKRLKLTTESNKNGTDAEPSDIPRDSSQKEDEHINSNSMPSNGLSSSPVSKVKGAVKFSRWKDKEVQVLDDSPENSEDGKDGEIQKRTVSTHSNSGSKINGVEESESGGANTADIVNSNSNTSKDLANSFMAEVCIIEPGEKTTPSFKQNSFKFLLKRRISRLCEHLTVEEDLRDTAIDFLDYVIENHHVNKEPETIVEAFVISLCWIAASLLKKKIDKKESISLARKHLGFTCKDQEVDSVYSKLTLLKKIYRQKIRVPSDLTTKEKTSGIKSPKHGNGNEHVTTILQDHQEETQKSKHDEVETLVVEKESTATIDSSDLPESEGQLSEVPDKTGNTGSDEPDSATNKNDDVTSSSNRIPPSAEPLSSPSDSAETDNLNHEGQTPSHDADMATSQLPSHSKPPSIPCTEGQISSQDADVAASQLPPFTEPPPVPLTGGQTPLQNADVAAFQLPLFTEPPPVPLTGGQTLLQNADVAASQLPVTSGPLPVLYTERQIPPQNADAAATGSPSIVEPVVGPGDPSGTLPLSNLDLVAENQNSESSHNRINHGVGPSQGSNLDFPLSMEQQLTSRMLSLPLHNDPIQMDLDNMRRFKDQAAKAHEDSKSKIKYECEKEIGEIVAQIRKKHGDRLREADAIYSSRKAKFEMHFNKVYMNKLLSHAFRIKCVGPTTAGLFFGDNVPGSNIMQQQAQLNSSFPPVVATVSSVQHQTTQPPPPVTPTSSARHQTMPPPPPVHPMVSSFRNQAPPPVTATSSIRQQALPPQTATSSVRQQAPPAVTTTSSARNQIMPPPGTSTPSARPQMPPSVTTTSSARNQTIPPPPIIATSSGRHQTMPPGFPQCPATGNHQSAAATAGGGEFRSMAPHLKRFRPPSSISTTSLPSNQQIPPGNHPSFFQPLTDQARNPNGSLPSALQLLLDINKISPANRPNLFPLLNTSSFNVPVTSTTTTVSTTPGDIVCLSDEE